MSETLPLGALTLDKELQPRAAIDRSVLENYMQLLVDGVRFPPVVAFCDGSVIWLADGFHRWHSRNALQMEEIDADIRNGSRRDALLYSLSANATHGLQRSEADYSHAYKIACRNELVDPTDVEAVVRLLQCSGRWAEKLTAAARSAAKEKRDAEIIRLHDEGKSNRAVAREVGVDEGTVRNVRAEKANSAEIPQDGRLSDTAKDKLRELAEPPAQNWASALRALRLINEQVSVDTLFEERFHKFDHVFGPALEAAHEWINELHGRFVNERNAHRRRA